MLSSAASFTILMLRSMTHELFAHRHLVVASFSHHHIHNYLHRSTAVSPQIFSPLVLQSSSTTTDSSVAATHNILWHMHRDECDEWLDEVLIEQSPSKDICSSKYHEQPSPPSSPSSSSIFQTASFVVESFISGDTEDANNTPLLRRVSLECTGDNIDIISSCEHPSSSWTDDSKMFDALFGTSSTSTQPKPIVGVASPDIKPINKRTSKKNKKRTNLKLTVAYRGLDFCGWEDQRHELYRAKNNNEDKAAKSNTENVYGSGQRPSVQGTLADILGPILSNDINTMSQQKINTKNKPIEIKVAGRTDRGVSAIGQVCRIRTYKDIDDIETYVKDTVNRETEKDCNVGLRIMQVEQVGHDFHPSFGASSRSYAYIIDLEDNDDDLNDAEIDSSRPRISHSLVPKLDRLLRTLEGRELDYYAMSHGKKKTQTTLCTLYHARAGIVQRMGNNDDASSAEKRLALCFEIIGNRFLRRMVRILVATALREAYRENSSDDALLHILSTKDRRQRSRAAPPDGLTFIKAEF